MGFEPTSANLGARDPRSCYFEERVSSPHDILFKNRSPRRHLMGLRSKLGKAAVIGGRAYVERVATSDEFAMIFCHGLDVKARRAAIEMMFRIAQRADVKPTAAKTPSPHQRVKIRWTDEFVARFKSEAPNSIDDVDLAARLGLPPYCRGAMRAARSRFGLLRGSQEGDPRSPPHTASPKARVQRRACAARSGYGQGLPGVAARVPLGHHPDRTRFPTHADPARQPALGAAPPSSHHLGEVCPSDGYNGYMRGESGAIGAACCIGGATIDDCGEYQVRPGGRAGA
jgi:hypothetical protein